MQEVSKEEEEFYVVIHCLSCLRLCFSFFNHQAIPLVIQQTCGNYNTPGLHFREPNDFSAKNMLSTLCILFIYVNLPMR